MSELTWARGRDGVQQTQLHLQEDGMPSAEDFMNSLLPSERERLQYFLHILSCWYKVCSLGQDPSFSCVASSEAELHTLIKNCHIQYSHEFLRWLTARECFLAQTFPTSNSTLLAYQPGATPDTLRPLCSMNVSRIAHGLTPRRRQSVANQAGNSMNVATIGSILQFCFLFFEFVDHDAARCSGFPVHVHDALSRWRKARGQQDPKYIPAPVVREPPRPLQPGPQEPTRSSGASIVSASRSVSIVSDGSSLFSRSGSASSRVTASASDAVLHGAAPTTILRTTPDRMSAFLAARKRAKHR